MGAQASQNGLVDRLGDLDTAVSLIRERAKLPPAAGINLVAYPPRRSLLDTLFNATPETVTEALTRQKLKAMMGDGLPSPAAVRGGMLAIMPYRITIH
jgi:ClpP class serine protease